MATVTVYFATNRKPTVDGSNRIVDFGSELGPIDGTAVRFGKIDVDVVRGEATARRDTLQVAPENLYPPGNQAPQHGSNAVFDEIRTIMLEHERPTLVVVHGFSNAFFDTVERAGLILDFYGIDANVFSFSWPSRGSPSGIPLPYADYAHDREMARRSGVAMARTLRILYRYMDRIMKEEQCRQPIHLICHSMGVYAFRHAVQALMRMPLDDSPLDGPDDQGRLLISVPTDGKPDPNNLRQTFEQVILAAADEDDDAFDDAAELKYLPRLGAAVTVYHTRRDWILSTLSNVTKFNGPRLGTNGPDNMSGISDKIVAVDVSNVLDVTEDFQNHQYYRTFPAVRDDIVSVLEGQRPDQIRNRTTLGSRRYLLTPPRRRARS
ncbi:alpha/beta fold hydrolase [Vineibacter terrae]|uniref:Alpha/beta fold hydrolase n=1 Tax=Vineibacter terrae TaxID=2586908 RepID=A0A5C8PSY3_9HYPH|nr:alpha/beta fold hydrolase [Vineibacter terrae]TXL78822.1 alpha/beta fold hydrolase [Vineibacter terrae]